MANFGWDYPPGVSGNEPQITGIWPAAQVIDEAVTQLRNAQSKIEEALADCEDQGIKFSKLEYRTQTDLENKINEVIDDLQSRLPEDY